MFCSGAAQWHMIAWSPLCIFGRTRSWIYHPAINQRITSACKNSAYSIHYIWFTLAPASQGAFTPKSVHTHSVLGLCVCRGLCCNGLRWIRSTLGFMANVLFINNFTVLCLKEPSIFTGRTERNINGQLQFVGSHQIVSLSSAPPYGVVVCDPSLQ